MFSLRTSKNDGKWMYKYKEYYIELFYENVSKGDM